MPEPMMKLDPAGQAPILSYNLPEAVAYSGKQFIELQIDGIDETWFKPVPSANRNDSTKGFLVAAVAASLTSEFCALGLLSVSPWSPSFPFRSTCNSPTWRQSA